MKAEIIRELSSQELKEKLKEEKSKLNKLEMAHTVSPLENPMELRSSRRTIARLSTELNGRKEASSK